MTENAQREMTLREWVERLPASHLARREYDALTAKAVRMNQAAGGEAVAWEVRVMYGPHGPDAGKWSKWQGCDKATHDAVQRGEGFCEYETAEARALVVIGTTPPAAQVQQDDEYLAALDKLHTHVGGNNQHPLYREFLRFVNTAHPAAIAQARATNGMVAAMRELTLRYQKHFDQAQFPPEFWAELGAAIAPQPEADTSGWSLLDRVEFALRGAGFDYDEAFRIAQLASKPAADALGAELESLRAAVECKSIDIRERDAAIVGWAERARKAEAALAQAPAVRVTDDPAIAALSGKYGEVLRPFVALMERELHANAGKGDRPGWLAMTPAVALLEIYYHVAKLQKAVKDDDGNRIIENSADVANMAMMLLDVCGGLALEDALGQGKAS